MDITETLKKFLSKTKAPRTKRLAMDRAAILKEFPRLYLVSRRAKMIAEEALNEAPRTTVVKSSDGMIYALKQDGKKPRRYADGVDDKGKPKYGFTFGGVTFVRLTFKPSEVKQMRRAGMADLLSV